MKAYSPERSEINPSSEPPISEKPVAPEKVFILTQVNSGIISVFKWLGVLCCATMFAVISLQVILRYGFNTGLPWAEELARITMICLAFFSIPAAYRHALNVRIDILPNALGHKLKLILSLLTHLAIVVFVYYFLKYSYEFTLAGASIYSTSIPFLTMNYIYAVMPISFVAFLLVIVERMILELKQLFL